MTSLMVNGKLVMSDKLRATGRTFRMLLRVMLKLSEGNDVIITADTYFYSRELSQQLMSLDPDSQLFTGWTNSGDVLTLMFVNGKTVKFMSHDKWSKLRGVNFTSFVTFSDHYNSKNDRRLNNQGE